MSESLPETIREFRQAARCAQSLGQLYAALDPLIAEIEGMLPHSHCQIGCGPCCSFEKMLFRVYQSEWALIEAYLHEQGLWEAAQRNAAAYRPFRPLLEKIQRGLERGVRLVPEPGEIPLRCPLLENGRCLVYPARAFICRTYGFFSIRNASGNLHQFACPKQARALDALGFQLPEFSALYATLERLVGTEEKRLLPLWF